MQTQTAGIGHNNPPSEIDLLKQRLDENTEDLRARQADLLQAFDRAPIVINNDEDCAKGANFIKQLQSAIKLADHLRTSEKEPYLAGGRIIDDFFRVITSKLNNAKDAMERRVTQRLQQKYREEQEWLEKERRAAAEEAAKAAETAPGSPEAIQAAAVAEVIAATEIARPQARGDMATVSLRTVTDFKIVDLQNVDLKLLRPYIAIADLEKAIRAAMRAGHTSIAGVEIFQTQKARL